MVSETRSPRASCTRGPDGRAFCRSDARVKPPMERDGGASAIRQIIDAAVIEATVAAWSSTWVARLHPLSQLGSIVRSTRIRLPSGPGRALVGQTCRPRHRGRSKAGSADPVGEGRDAAAAARAKAQARQSERRRRSRWSVVSVASYGFFVDVGVAEAWYPLRDPWEKGIDRPRSSSGPQVRVMVIGIDRERRGSASP